MNFTVDIFSFGKSSEVFLLFVYKLTRRQRRLTFGDDIYQCFLVEFRVGLEVEVKKRVRGRSYLLR